MKIRHLAPASLIASIACLAGPAWADQHAGKPAQAAKPAQADKPQATAHSGPEYQTRDWSKIDTNKDNLISPEEMEAYLAANPGPLRTSTAKK